jgi:nucleoside-diphosphate-sugar epimerase
MRILLTGASGFIGQPVLQRLLAAGHEVLAVTRFGSHSARTQHPNLRFLVADLSCLSTVEPELARFKPDTCVHTAWHGIPDYSELTCRVNLLMAINLFSFLAHGTSCSRLIGLGSCLEYHPLQGQCLESEAGAPHSFFSWAKQSIGDFGTILAREQSREFFWLRVFYVYGARQRSQALIPTLIRQFKQGERPVLQSPGNLNDFIYVDDVADAVVQAATGTATSGTYNLGSGVPRSILDVCASVEREISGRTQLADSMREEASAPPKSKLWADISQAKKRLGWEPRVSFEEGIRRVKELSESAQNNETA